MSPVRHRRGAAGFTIFELMIVVAIAAIMATIAIPGMRSFLQSERASAAAVDLVTSLSYARSEAIKEDVPVAGGNGVHICASSDGTTCDAMGNWSNGWIVRTSNPNLPSPLESFGALTGGLTLTPNPAAADIYFKPDGTTNLGALVEFTLCDSRGAAYAREVEIDVTGRIESSPTLGEDVTGAALACP